MMILGIVVTIVVLISSLLLAIPASYFLTMCPDSKEWAIMFVLIFSAGVIFLAEPSFSYAGIIIEGIVI